MFKVDSFKIYFTDVIFRRFGYSTNSESCFTL